MRMCLKQGLMIAVMVFGLVGCKALPMLEQLVEKPSLSVDNFSMGEASILKQTFRLRLKVDNPNQFALPILGLNYGVNIAGVEVADGSQDSAVTIPAGGSDYLDIAINTNLLKSLPGLSGVLMQGGKEMAYEVTGAVQTNNSLVRTIPFQKSGNFDLAF